MNIHTGVDFAQENGEKTAVVFVKNNNDGTATILTGLEGEAAEYVAALVAVADAARPAATRLKLIQAAGPLGRSPQWTQNLIDALAVLDGFDKE